MAMQASTQSKTLAATPGFAAFALSLALGCASAKIETTQRMAAGEQLPRPPIVVVYDFAVSPQDALADTFGSELAGGSGSAQEASDLGHRTARALSQAIVAAMNQRGIAATRGTPASVPPLHAVVLKGEFLKIEEGSRLKRMTIGFGAGTPELRTLVQVYQVTDSGLRRLAEAEAQAVGARTPGMALPVVGGAALGRAATSAVISGGMNVAREVKGAIDDEISRMAEEIAESAKRYYEQRGWL